MHPARLGEEEAVEPMWRCCLSPLGSEVQENIDVCERSDRQLDSSDRRDASDANFSDVTVSKLSSSAKLN